MKIKVIHNKEKLHTLPELQVGDVFEVVDGGVCPGYEGQFIICCFSDTHSQPKYICLNDPRSTWMGIPGFKGRIYRKDSGVKLEITL